MGNQYVGEETPGASNPTPDQNAVDEIGRAYGLQEEDTGALRSAGKSSSAATAAGSSCNRRASPAIDREGSAGSGRACPSRKACATSARQSPAT